MATSCGLPPGNVAWTEMVGKSTCGRGETGSLQNPTTPAAARPQVSNVVPIGLPMKGADRPIFRFKIAVNSDMQLRTITVECQAASKLANQRSNAFVSGAARVITYLRAGSNHKTSRVDCRESAAR